MAHTSYEFFFIVAQYNGKIKFFAEKRRLKPAFSFTILGTPYMKRRKNT